MLLATVLAVVMAGSDGGPVSLVVEPTRLAEPSVPTGVWSFEWGPDVRPPEVEQAGQVGALRGVSAAAAGLVALLAALVVVGLLLQRDIQRRSEYWLRRALGARRSQLASSFAGSAWRWGLLVVLTGAAAVVVMPWMISGTFPGRAEVPEPVAAAMLVGTGFLVLVLRWEAGAGRRATRPRSAFLRVVSGPTAVAAVGFAALTGVGLLHRHAPGSPTVANDPGRAPAAFSMEVSLADVPMEERGVVFARWAADRHGSDGAPRSAAGRAVGVASAGARRGTGHDARVWVDCGSCFEGGLPMPLKTVRAEVHAVAQDTFTYLGLELLEGRDFRDAADTGSPSVAVVSRSLAVRHFENGEAVGRRIRVGTSPWMTVVGVVSDAVDIRDHAEYAVYLSVAQAMPSSVELLATESVELDRWGRVPIAGTRNGPVKSTAALFAVHGWFADLLRLVGALACLLVFFGVWLGSRNEARATLFELSLRRALGARRRDVRRHLVGAWGRRLLVAVVVGAWLSLFLGAVLSRAHGTIPNLDPVVWLQVGALVAVAWVTGAWPTYVRAARLDPVEGLRATR